ncbi:zinc finger protein 185 isoform X3 [Salminus brasiliensis]|uniref:zinc finger protein 185 isoform X3 n=1 Tax=Salminus brasiliensis TaxID=930266 RepID=UPI003B837BD1
MTTEGDRQSVLRTTKVRTALKGDSSWIQRRKDPDQEEEEEKPWVAEVRAGRVNGAINDTAPETMPTQPEPQPKTSTDDPKAQTPGYLIRGVFTKTDTKPPSLNATNGYIGTSGFNKRPSEGYKKIAPHTVRPSLENTAAETEPAISNEEQERRTEAASNVLRNSVARQRSYVLSAAKKYESPSEKPDSSDPSVVSFVAKRVMISDDEDSVKAEPKAPEPKAAEPPAAPASPAPQVQPAPKQSLEMSVDEPAPPVAAVRKKTPSATPRAEAAPKQSGGDALDALSDSLLSSTPAPSSVSKPAAEVNPPAPESKQAPSTAPEAKPKTEPTSKPSATEPVTPALPVAKEAPSTTPETKPKEQPTLKPSAPAPTAPAVPAAQKTPSATAEPKQEPAPKQSVTEPAPVAPVAQKAPSTTPEVKPKTEPIPKPSVTEPIAQVTPVAPVAAETKAPAAVPEAKPEAKLEPPKPSVTGPVPATPVAQKTPTTTPTTKAEPTPKPSVTEPVPAAPVAQKTPTTTPTTKAEPTPKPRVTEPVPAAPVAQKTPSTTPEAKPKTEPTPKPSVAEPVPDVPTVPVTQQAPSTTPEAKPKTEPTPKPSVTQPLPAVPVAQKAPSTTPEVNPKTEPTPKPSVTEPVPVVQKTPTPKPKTEPTLKASDDPKPVKKTNDLNNDDLLGLTQSTSQKPVNPVPTTTDLLTGADSSLPKSEKTNKSLDLLAVDIIPINTNTDNSQPQPEKTQKSLDLLAFDLIPINTKNDKLSTDKTQSKVETMQTVLQPKKETKSSTDPFDPIPIVSECTKSPVELFDPLLLDSDNIPSDGPSFSIEDITPGDTDFTSLSTDTSDEHFDSGVPASGQRSSDNSSPWDRWTSPILSTATEPRETKADPQPMETYTAYTRKVDKSALDPKSQDPDPKKGIVYVKEYVNTPQFSAYNGSDLDYVTSTSSSYAYSSPSSSTNMSACTYCGALVGNDAKITIEHLNISCHPECFKCGICSKPMGDFLDNMFLHRGTVHCESCYANVL